MHRKEFIKSCGFACLGGMAFTMFLQSCASKNYFAQSFLRDNKIVIKKSEFTQEGKNKTVLRKYVLIRSEKTSYPICVYKLGNDNYSAVLMQCSHKGCELNPQGNFLICPCHGSEFTNLGVVKSPPAEQNLQTFNITADDEHIYIQL